MLCPECKRENDPTSHFCIFCGAILPASEAEGSSGPAEGSGDISPEQVHELRREVSRLEGLVVLMNERLASLERARGAPAPLPESAPAPPTAPPVAVPLQEAAPPVVGRVPPRKVKPLRTSEREWEQILGGSWLARIGVLSLVIGIGFFLKFAFDNDWIGPTGRVILGIIAGLVLLGLGYYWRKKYLILTQVLSGGGIAVLYLSIFASFAIYDLIHFYSAFVFLLLVSIASAALALRYNSVALAVIGILGAFVAPFILGSFGDRGIDGTDRVIQILVYIIVVDLGVLVLSTFRNWRWFTLLALVCSLIAFGVWYDKFRWEISLATSEVGLTLIFLIFVGATTLFHIVWRRVPQAFDFALMLINAAAYFGISLGLMRDDFNAWMGGFALLLALFYSALAYIALKRSTENVRLSLFALGIALVLLTVAIPVQLGNQAWTTIAWAAEGAVLVWLSFILRMPQLRWYSYVVFFIVAVRLLFFDTSVNVRTFLPVFNERFLAFLVSIAALYVSGYFLLQERKISGRGRAGAAVFFVAANFFSLWILSAEVLNYFDSRIIGDVGGATARALRDAQNLSLTAVWAFYAVIALVVGIVKRWHYLRLGALGLLVIAIGKVFVYDVFKLELGYRIIAFVGLGVLLLVSAYLYQRYSQIIKGVFVEK